MRCECDIWALRRTRRSQQETSGRGPEVHMRRLWRANWLNFSGMRVFPVIGCFLQSFWSLLVPEHLKLLSTCSWLHKYRHFGLKRYIFPLRWTNCSRSSRLWEHTDSGVAGVCATSFRKSRYPACFLTPHRRHIHPHAVCSLAVAKGFPRLSLHQTAANWRR